MFLIDPQIEQGSHFIHDLELSQLRLQNDSRYPWVMLIPRLASACEIIDLDEAQSHLFIQEIRIVSHALRTVFPCDKINVASLGNKVRQLHIHIIARRIDDPAWPGAVWDKGPSVLYDGSVLKNRTDQLKSAILT
jgi:diadenosine tetraphosphate (Ap4A) HIT family hydrolase